MPSQGRSYVIESQNAVASPTKTALTITSTTAIRPWISDADVGSSATPGDTAPVWWLQRFTAAGTTTAYVPPPLDPGDPASTFVGGVTATIEPTYTAAKVLFHAAVNQRATHRFNWDPQRAPTCPATNSNGIGLFVVHASFTGNVDAYCIVVE